MTSFWRPAPVLVAGPCVLESDALNLQIGERLAEIGRALEIRIIYKASFDKANRARGDAPRGPGLDEGLKLLERVKRASGLPVLTDVHEANQVKAVSQVVDALQIPAFLCRQTDLLRAAGATGKPVNLKKGQWVDPDTMGHAVEKVRSALASSPRSARLTPGVGALPSDADPKRQLGAPGAPEDRSAGALAVTERGTFFGYGDLVVDMRSFGRLKAATGATVLFDATHSVQRPGQAADGSTAGTRHEAPALLFAAAAAGADGFYLETHPDPAASPSDSHVIWPLDELQDLIAKALDVWSRSGAMRELAQ